MGFLDSLVPLVVCAAWASKVPTQEKGYNKGIPKCCGRRDSVCGGGGGGGRGAKAVRHDRNFCNFFNLNNFTVSNKA